MYYNFDLVKTFESIFLVFDTTLEKDIKDDTSGCFECLLLLLCQGRRDESSTVDVPAAKQDALALFNAGLII
jgi:hypothetical protein